ncbi:hypothetical protein [Tsukamurella soli]|uniref:ASCH domain-containing protein n=1 Tax=Tsukamurella soli TaxID=644556 RepID=A0ABP8KF23_9ACTN
MTVSARITRVHEYSVLDQWVGTGFEPTPKQMAERHAAIERRRRTLLIGGPADLFGPGFPRAGERVTIDLGDPRLRKHGYLADRTDRVTGMLREIQALPPAPEGVRWHACTPIVDTDEPVERILITFEVDR